MAEKTIEQYKAIWRNLNDEIKKHLECKDGGDYLIPTDTVWGVVHDATKC
jgi:tRNA A37 threonylcarbamoyladenosine synthetase subunit TsaC/SUA5/YrdC